jgi:hypothetical protein
MSLHATALDVLARVAMPGGGIARLPRPVDPPLSDRGPDDKRERQQEQEDEPQPEHPASVSAL